MRRSAQPRFPVERSIARMGRALYIEWVEDAASAVGGYEQLAAELGVGADEVRNWSSGMTIPECTVFLQLLGLLLKQAPARDSESGESSG